MSTSRSTTSPRRHLGWLLLLPLAAGLGTARAHAEEAPRPKWAKDLEALRVEVDPAARVSGTWLLLGAKPDPAELRAELARPPVWKTPAAKGVVEWQRDVGDGKKLTVYAYVPQAYTPEKAWPVIVWMHGGINRPSDGGGKNALDYLRDEAEAKGHLAVAPSGTSDTMWWSAAGVAHVRGSLVDLARRYRVDPDRVAAAGFSDGASGCFHLLAHDPDPYACFLAPMGNPMITRILGGPAFAGNCAARPTWAVNGGQDTLYPADQLEPIFEDMKDQGIPVEWKGLPEAGHRLPDVAPESDAMLAFWKAHPRDALPKRVDWECTVPALDGRRAWIEILTVDAAAPGAPDVPAQPLFTPPPEPPRPRLGITLDNQHEGAGLLIREVQKGTPAAEAGFKPGDVVLKAGGEDLPEGDGKFQALRTYLDSLDTEDGEFTVKRGEETVTIKTRPRALASDEPNPALGFGKPSGRVVAEVKDGNRIEVKTRAVSALRLHLARPLVDTTKELVVMLNGKEAFRGVPKADVAYLLNSALGSLPGDPLYEANLTLKP